MKFFFSFLFSLSLMTMAFAQTSGGCGSSSGNGMSPEDADCFILGPSSLLVDDQAVYTVDITAQCTDCYDWDISGDGIIVGSDQNSSVAIQATGAGSITLSVTVFTEDGCVECCTIIEVESLPPPRCCFEFWVTPKWFPYCYTTCNGNLDNVVELHQQHCDDLPEGYTTAITGIDLLTSATLGNCHQCANPITSLPSGSSPVNSLNIAVCGPQTHSMLIEMTIYDASGNIVQVCEDNYFRFVVDECSGGPRLDTNPQGVLEDRSIKVQYQALSRQLQISSTSTQEVATVNVYNLTGKLLGTFSTQGLIAERVQTYDLDLPITGIYLVQLLDQSGGLIQSEKIISFSQP